MRKDQQRRLKYQEEQRIKSNCNGKDFKHVLGSVRLTEGQLKELTSKLVK